MLSATNFTGATETTGYGMQMVFALSASQFALLDEDQLGRHAMNQQRRTG